MLSFSKLVGAGNDFVFTLSENLPSNLDRAEFAKKICDRQNGIGADGLAIIDKLDQDNFVWDFYNNDGSKAEMCGNAARCCVLYIREKYGPSDCKFETLAGTVEGHIVDGLVQVSWELKSDKMAEVSVDLENFKSFTGQFINTGVPHFVLVDQLTKVTKADCREIQAHPQFGSAQTNVTLLDTDESGIHHTKTFERGVKDFTQACGTGVIASAFVLQSQKKSDVYKLQAPGGNLSVKIDGKKVTLIGPAHIVFEGTIEIGEL